MNSQLHKISRKFLNANSSKDFLECENELLTYFNLTEQYTKHTETVLKNNVYTNSLAELNVLKTAEEMFLYGIVPTAAIVVGAIHSLANNRYDLQLHSLIFGGITLLNIECTLMLDKFNECNFSKFRVDMD